MRVKKKQEKLCTWEVGREKKQHNKRNENFVLRISQRDRQGNDIQMDSVVELRKRCTTFTMTHTENVGMEKGCSSSSSSLYFLNCVTTQTKRETLASCIPFSFRNGKMQVIGKYLKRVHEMENRLS